MAGYLTTHVLDTARGRPGEGIKIELFRVSGNSHRKIATSVTNSDGRTDAPILNHDKFSLGNFELVFFVGDYLRRLGAPEDQILFLDEIPIRFGMSEQVHYHVPLLLSPYGYSTYRGS